MDSSNKTEIFERMSIGKALSIMAFPTIVSQIITLIYNMTDTFFIGRTNNPYMVGAASMVATVFLMVQTIANIFGVGGGNQVVYLLGKDREDEARKVAKMSMIMAFLASLFFALLIFFFHTNILNFLGASKQTFEYAKQYLMVVVVIGAIPTVLSNAMSYMIRNIGYSKESAFGLAFGGILNIALDPIFMFMILPKGYEVLGAAIATLLSNVVVFIYFIYVYHRLRNISVLSLDIRPERIEMSSLKSIFAIGLPAGLSLLFYDLTNMMLNRLCAIQGDTELAAMGIILKVERLPLNIGVGICLGMTPLMAYNYAADNKERMYKFFSLARTVGVIVALTCVALYYVFARDIMAIFIHDAMTIDVGTTILKARCFATPVMFLSFHMVYFMQAVKRGLISFWLAFIRQLCLNIPLLLVLNLFFGMSGIVWTQAVADSINVIISYLIYFKVKKSI